MRIFIFYGIVFCCVFRGLLKNVKKWFVYAKYQQHATRSCIIGNVVFADKRTTTAIDQSEMQQDFFKESTYWWNKFMIGKRIRFAWVRKNSCDFIKKVLCAIRVGIHNCVFTEKLTNIKYAKGGRTFIWIICQRN